MKTVWIRTCQECGNQQESSKPDQTKELTDSFRNKKCKKCKSEGSLDYGSEMKKLELSGNFVSLELNEDEDSGEFF